MKIKGQTNPFVLSLVATLLVVVGLFMYTVSVLTTRIDALYVALEQEQDAARDRGDKPVAPDPDELVDAPAIPGKDGEDGEDGKDGSPGTDGKDGKDGEDGEDGEDGINGEDGADGENGNDGSPGADGAQGPRGPQGPPGPACPDGYTLKEREYDPDGIGPRPSETWLVCVKD